LTARTASVLQISSFQISRLNDVLPHDVAFVIVVPPASFFHPLFLFYPGRSIEPFQWKHGPILKVLPNFRVPRIAPSRTEEAWV
jgi:hypothetical protein